MLFIAGSGALAALASSPRGFSLLACAVSVAAYLIAGRVQFPVGRMHSSSPRRSIDASELDVALARMDSLIRTRARRMAVVADPAGFDRLAAVLRNLDQVEVVRVDPADGALALRTGPYDLGVMAFDRREASR
jgi:hypothetical protein